MTTKQPARRGGGLWWAVVMLGVAIAAAAWPWPSDRVESAYSRGVYPALQPILTGASNLVSVSFLDVALLAALGAVVWLAWRVVAAGSGRRLGALWRAVAAAGGIAGAAYLGFVALWGLNYQRQPLARQISFDASRVTPASVRALADRAVAAANTLRAGLPVREAEWPADGDVARALAPPYARTIAALGLPGGVRPAQPKVPLLTVYFRAAGVSGMTNPFGLETLLADNLLPFERPLAIAHEWGHLAGLGPESEAGFVGFLTCMRADRGAQYSAWLDMALRCARGLPAPERSAVLGRLSPAVVADVCAMSARSARDEVRWLNVAAWSTYDTYLRAHRVEGGVRSYDQVVTLVVGTAMGEDWVPVRRR